MTEYWKSQAKKYCDFCKCWIADNAPNVSFHVNGWKHKANVKNKISQMTKQSQKEYQNQLKVDDEIKKMEEAAMQAYMKDIEASADLTSKVIQETRAERQKAEVVEVPEKSNEEDDDDDDDDDDKDKDKEKEKAKEEEAPVIEEKKWLEAQSDEGYTYYWHVDTGESRWEPPEEGFLSLAQQKAEEKKKQKKQVAEVRRKKAEEDRRLKEQAEEERARQEREKMKSRRKAEEKPEEPDRSNDATAAVVGPAPRVDPYGSWTVVDNRPQKLVDLQLPQQDFVAFKVPVETIVEEPQARFKEKTISGLSDSCDLDGSVVSFKKRKLGSSTKKNTRQRLDDDC